MRIISKMICLIPLCCAAYFPASTTATEETKGVETYKPFFIGEHKPYLVGELGAKWQFPSDHLPRGITFQSEDSSSEGLHIAFWNILNKNYLNHIEENTQGLRDSSILPDNFPVDGDSKLTVRELCSIEIILGMINHTTHPRSLIGLEEAHRDVLNDLKKKLPAHWKMVTPPGQPNSQDLFIYDTDIFEYVGVNVAKYQENLPKSIFTLLLKEKSSGHSYRFLQSHVPGGPNSTEGCEKFAKEAIKNYRVAETTVLMGDMNASPSEILKALQQATINVGMPKQPFHYVSIDYPSHVNTNLEASWIDNFFAYTPKSAKRIHASHHSEEIRQYSAHY